MCGLLVVAAACSSDNKPTGTGAGSSAASSSDDSAILGPANKATGTPVKVGVFNVEGGQAISLPEIGDAAVAAAKYANDHLGGLAGHPIEIDRCADKADGASATACGNQFVQNSDAAVVATQPAQADQAVPAIVGAKIPYVGAAPAATSEITSDGTYFFSPGFVGVLAAMAKYDKDNSKPKHVMFGIENPMLTAAVGAIGKPLFQALGGDLELVTIPPGTADASSQVQQGLSLNPDVVSVIGDQTTCQTYLSALQTAGYAKEKLVIAPCTGKTVQDAVGAALDNATLFDYGARVGSDNEAKLYAAVMKTYAPNVDATGSAIYGYIAMLGFIRAVNAGGLTGDATPASITAAIKQAKNVPLPLGQTETFSCDTNSIANPLFKALVCNAKIFVTKLQSGQPTTYQVIDTGPLFAG